MAELHELQAPAAALDALSGALAAAEHVDPDDASRLVAHARAAFVAGMHTALSVAALAAGASAVLVYLRLDRAHSREVSSEARPDCV